MNNTVQRWVILALLGLVLTTALPIDASAERRSTTVSLKIQTVLDRPESPRDSGPATVRAKITSGQLSGRTFTYTHQLWGHPLYDPPLQPGESFVARLTLSNDTITRVELGQTRKDITLLLLFVGLTVALFLVGGWEGLIGLLCSLATLAGVLFVFFPLVFTRPLILTVGLVLCLLTIVITVPLILRFSAPVLPAVSSLVIVTLLTAVLAHVGMLFLHLNPDKARHSRLIMTHLNRAPGVTLSSLRPLLVVGIVLGTLGAMMDVAVVISSTVHEIMRDDENATLRGGFGSGMRVGREILSTMVNTLIFAYMGVLFPLLMALRVFDLSWLHFLNYSTIGIEILRVNVGLLGLSLIIPFTALLSAWWFSR